MSPTSGEEKAAILLANLDPATAESVLVRLGPRAGRLRAEMQRLGPAARSPETLAPILRDLEEVLRNSEREQPKLQLVQEPEAAKPPARPPAPEPPPPVQRQPEAWEIESGGDPLVALAKVPLDRLVAALRDEQPRTVSLVLNHLNTERAGEVLKLLPAELRREVSVRLGQGTGGNLDLLRRIARVLVEKCRAVAENPSAAAPDAKYKRIAEMLRLLDKPERMDVLATLEQRDPETAAQVKDCLYSFEDLLLIADRSMQKMLSEIDSKGLAVALKGAPEEIKAKVLGNLSKRAQETLTEEMEFLTTVPPAEIKEAQKVIVALIQRLDQAGELVMEQ